MKRYEIVDAYKEENKKYLIIIFILLTILAILFGIHLSREYLSIDNNYYDMNNNTSTSANNLNTVHLNELDPPEEEKDIIWISNEEDEKKYEVFILNNELHINEEIVDTNINEYYMAPIGSNDCLNNTYIITLKEDATIGALRLDGLYCEDTIEYNKKINDLENVLNIYFEPSVTEDDIIFNDIYAKTEEDSTLINDYLTLK